MVLTMTFGFFSIFGVDDFKAGRTHNMKAWHPTTKRRMPQKDGEEPLFMGLIRF